ncbi:hypothetical protein Y919_03765 [Caloranaerobacter azorensis H53214]|uniref:Uncharacterized protein n=2 Tax=Caloranaerobacter azorensis TaxID=116090 RepID=A0A1M5T5Y3_9FIRM|nr:hypothetical protein [Caloranaerobacter azorensis]KGG80872.1 hypothetical protein Y919_03765 [Caloranaerobacter azorensis H53214]SHH46098.1 hypothetical protein SAMN02745135_00864 [Caloranaerobacter azorensis DSM 13643]
MKKFLFVFLTVVLLISTLTVNVSFGSSLKDLLLIVDNINNYDLSFIEKDYANLRVDVGTIDDLTIESINKYNEIAVPFNLVDERIKIMLRKAYEQNKKIYLYGELTLKDYSEVMGLWRFGKYVDIYSSGSKKIKNNKKVFMFFGNKFEQNEIQNVVALSKNEAMSGLIASIDKDKLGSYNKNLFLKAILDDVMPNSKVSVLSNTVRKSEFNFKTYNTYGGYVVMDYTLYQETDETDSTYDYFSIRTNLMLEGEGKGIAIDVEHNLPFSSDELLEYGPESTEDKSQIEVSVGYGDGGPSGSLSYIINMSSKPNINTTASLTDDRVSWRCKKTLFGGFIDGQRFSPASTWASTESYAAIDIKFRGLFTKPGGGSVYTSWKTVNVRFNY